MATARDSSDGVAVTERHDEIGIGGFLADHRALVLSGGISHPYHQGCVELVAVLDGAGLDVDQIGEPDELARLQHELLVVDALWWTMGAARYDAVRDEWARSLDDLARQAIDDHISLGRSVLAVHTAVLCFDDWPRWGDILGARWDWQRSFHPPLSDEPVTITVATDRHAITRGIRSFDIVDEVYGFLELAGDLDPLATSPHGGADHPLLWVRELPSGSRVVVDLLGHDRRSMDHLVHRELLRRSVHWLVGSDEPMDGEAAA